jgi:hypothetical protein
MIMSETKDPVVEEILFASLDRVMLKFEESGGVEARVRDVFFKSLDSGIFSLLGVKKDSWDRIEILNGGFLHRIIEAKVKVMGESLVDGLIAKKLSNEFFQAVENEIWKTFQSKLVDKLRYQIDKLLTESIEKSVDEYVKDNFNKGLMFKDVLGEERFRALSDRVTEEAAKREAARAAQHVHETVLRERLTKDPVITVEGHKIIRVYINGPSEYHIEVEDSEEKLAELEFKPHAPEDELNVDEEDPD